MSIEIEAQDVVEPTDDEPLGTVAIRVNGIWYAQAYRTDGKAEPPFSSKSKRGALRRARKDAEQAQ